MQTEIQMAKLQENVCNFLAAEGQKVAGKGSCMVQTELFETTFNKPTQLTYIYSSRYFPY